MRGSDPYQKEREQEYSAYNRFTIRAMPACIVGYIFYAKAFVGMMGEGGVYESIKVLLLVVLFHINIEAIYKFLRNDNIFFTLAVFSLWCWCLYKVFWMLDYNIFELFIPLNVVLSMAVIIIGAMEKYIKVKESIYQDN